MASFSPHRANQLIEEDLHMPLLLKSTIYKIMCVEIAAENFLF